MNTETSRRAFIAGSAAVAVVASAPADAVSIAADRSEWEIAMARFRLAKAAHGKFFAVFERAYAAEVAFEEARGVVHQLPDGSWTRDYFDRRRALRAELGTSHVVPDHMHERIEALSDRMNDAERAALDTPAPDLAALRWKLDRLTVEANEPDGDLPPWSHEYVRQTLADIARLMPEGR